jgi:mannose-6-phosphate isomerase-like protein (cupin superfamily)
MQTYYMSDKKGLNNTWSGMNKAIVEAYRDGYRVEHIKDIVKPEFNLDNFGYAWWSFYPETEYTTRLEAWLKSGWIAISEVSLNGVEHIGSGYGTDHFVVVDGAKAVWEDNSLKHYVHVVCSAKGTYWINTRDFLVKHGAAAWILIRKDTRR